MKKSIVAIAIVALVTAAWAELRIWTGKNGQTIEAEYVRDASGKVWLKPVTGKTKVVPINALCEEDQNYILKKKLPKIEIEVDDDIKRSTVGADIDNVAAEMKCSVTITKTSRNPYPVDYEVSFYVLAMHIRYKEYFIADKIVETFSLDEKSKKSVTFTGKQLNFEYDPDPPWGTRYEGYAVVVKTTEGAMLATKGKDKFVERVHLFKDAKVGTRFTRNFEPSSRSRY